MAQLSLYIDDITAEKLSIAAKEKNCSISKYVSTIILDRLSDDASKEDSKMELLRSLRGSIDDTTFSPSEDFQLVAESNRRYDLL